MDAFDERILGDDAPVPGQRELADTLFVLRQPVWCAAILGDCRTSALYAI